MKIGIITAMPEESAAVLKTAVNRNKTSRDGRSIIRCEVEGNKVTLIEAGMGLLNAGWAATALSAEKPDLIISTGFGGAVQKGLEVGDIVAARHVLQLSGAVFEEVTVGIYGLNSISDKLGLKSGTFISSDAIMDKATLSRQLPENCSYPVVEMETAAVARIAASNGIPFLGIRAISDPWNEELDFSIHEFCDDSMKISIAKVLATIARRPRIIPQLIRLARNSSVAAGSLAVAMRKLFLQI